VSFFLNIDGIISKKVTIAKKLNTWLKHRDVLLPQLSLSLKNRDVYSKSFPCPVDPNGSGI
jgi:hypothetical protein